MAKTITEWLAELPAGYRELALDNYHNFVFEYLKDNPKVPNLKTAINSFDYKKTPKEQGVVFWCEILCFYSFDNSNLKLPPLP